MSGLVRPIKNWQLEEDGSWVPARELRASWWVRVESWWLRRKR